MHIGGKLAAVVVLVGAFGAGSCASTARKAPPRVSAEDGLPGWVKDVGARRVPRTDHAVRAADYGAVNDGKTLCTAGIQRAIDACAAGGGGTVTLEPGTYLTGALFMKDGVRLSIDKGTTLLGSKDEADYPVRPTRVAGIEMDWPAALINVEGRHNVEVSGGGTIDGQGEVWWEKYRTLRRGYEPRGLRWASDYDAGRVRLIVAFRSSDVTVRGLNMVRSGFWNVHACYSDHVTVDGLTIARNPGPSTDGVDVDSSSYVLVQNCDIDNNDDCICLKAGRDSDGLRVNLPTEYVVVRDNVTRKGGGIVSLGSETSGGIRHVVAYRNTGLGTSVGIRFKSARTRGGFIEDVIIRDTTMRNVPVAFSFELNWNPSYSYASMPASMPATVPAHWVVMTTRVEPPERGICQMRNVTIDGADVTGSRKLFTAGGMPGKELTNFTWRNVTAAGREAGEIEYARDWTFENVKVITPAGTPVKVTNSAGVGAPLAVKGPAGATTTTTRPATRDAY